MKGSAIGIFKKNAYYLYEPKGSYSSKSPRLLHSIMLISEGKITAVGHKAEVKVPENSRLVEAARMVLTAAYWNSHVHFTGQHWQGAEGLAAAQLNRQLEEMLTLYVFAGKDLARDMKAFAEVAPPLPKGKIIYQSGVEK